MSLYNKLIKLYPSLSQFDFAPFQGTIILQNDSDGKGDYIKEWKHPTLSKPTEQQLAAIS
jgi:hypothetical protein